MYGSRQLIPLKLPKITQVNLTYPVSILGSRKERKGHIETRHLKYLVRVSFARTREAFQGMPRLMGSRRGANALRTANDIRKWRKGRSSQNVGKPRTPG